MATRQIVRLLIGVKKSLTCRWMWICFFHRGFTMTNFLRCELLLHRWHLIHSGNLDSETPNLNHRFDWLMWPFTQKLIHQEGQEHHNIQTSSSRIKTHTECDSNWGFHRLQNRFLHPISKSSLKIFHLNFCAKNDQFFSFVQLFSSFNFVQCSILSNFQLCPMFNFVQFSILSNNFQFCPIFNFVQFSILIEYFNLVLYVNKARFARKMCVA